MWKRENNKPHEQPQLHVQLGFKNNLEGMSQTHSDKTSSQECHN